MFEARRIPPTGAANGGATPVGKASGGVLAADAQPAERRRARVVGAIAPGARSTFVSPQARVAAAWRSWLRADQPHGQPRTRSLDAAAPTARIALANAEVLVWQNRLRLGFVATTGPALLALRLLGALPASPVAERALGDRGAIVAHVACLVAYLCAVLALQRRLAVRRSAGLPTVLGLALGDQLTIYAATFLLTPPAYYARALPLAYASLQLTQMFFGRRVASLTLAATVAGYAAMCVVALQLGGAVHPVEEAWTLVLFVAAAGATVTIKGTLTARVDRLVELFERTEVGDFTQEYDEAADARPDAFTRVGRAYNRMRVQLSTIVLTDPLSGALNRRGFDQQLARELARVARVGGEIAVIGIDIDYFKRINDTFGHLAGDAVIREAGALLREVTRAGDSVARVGGEEFMVIAPDTGAAGGFGLAARVVDAFRKRAFEGVAGRIPVTVSAGVAADVVKSTDVAEDLKARADEALYAAKRAGRNRVAVWSGERGRG